MQLIMKNLTKAMRITFNDSIVFLTIEYDQNDELHCLTPIREIVIPWQEEGQFELLLDHLKDLGIHPIGCFNCLFFSRSGMQIESGGTLGYCLEGKLGQQVNIHADMTAMEWSCQAYIYGDKNAQDLTKKAWSSSIRKPVK